MLSETLALLCIGLVSRWGEVVPDRFPIIGGRRVPPMAAVVPATIGGLVLTAVSATMVLSWFGVTGGVAYENVWWETLAEACVAPLALWGPITLALTCAYYLRRRPAGRRDQRVAQASVTAAGSQ
ncbi:hypothetical protein [Actinomadura sp. 21ATH]|uniref:hypothetical protein n=1 Tax=Actinomadura sp. 21ATH TaxID=1735444 RepID=UPI0035C1D9F7